MYTSHSSPVSVVTISQRVGGTLYGNPARTIVGLCARDHPIADHLTFLRVKSARALEGAIRALEGAVALAPAALLSPETDLGEATAIAVPDPYATFLDLIPLFFQEHRPAAGVHQTAVIDPSAEIDSSASIGAHCTVGAAAVVGAHTVLHSKVTVYANARIGEYSVLHSGVVIREQCVLGARCVVHNNSVIGADGFGYIPDPRRGLRKVPQIGAVEIADDVEIGANSCIDRGALGNTRIGRGTKIDNLVQVGHNVTIGAHCIVCGQVGIAGSTQIEDGVILGGQSGVADHLRLAAGVRVGGGASVTQDLLEPGDYLGFPIMRAAEWRRYSVEIRNRRIRKKS